jgi:hypothetical protein
MDHLGRVITKDLVDYDYLFTLGEPSLWSEPCLCLRGRGWHVETRGDAYSQCYQASVDVIKRINRCRVNTPLALSRIATCELMQLTKSDFP